MGFAHKKSDEGNDMSDDYDTTNENDWNLLKAETTFGECTDYYEDIIITSPMAENFVAVWDIFLKFHNLSAKFVCNFNE